MSLISLQNPKQGELSEHTALENMFFLCGLIKYEHVVLMSFNAFKDTFVKCGVRLPVKKVLPSLFSIITIS